MHYILKPIMGYGKKPLTEIPDIKVILLHLRKHQVEQLENQIHRTASGELAKLWFCAIHDRNRGGMPWEKAELSKAHRERRLKGRRFSGRMLNLDT
jgi:hypothetical protein